MSEIPTGWALAKLSHGASKLKLDTAGPLDDLAARFGVDALGREVLALAWAAERSLEVAKKAREAAGSSARALTVEVVSDALGRPLDALLAAGAVLRRHALVTLDTAGPALATSELRLSVGVAARLDGKPLELDGFAPGVRAAPGPLDAAWIDRFPASAKVAEMVKERVASIEALFATVDGCPRRDAIALALGAAKRFQRGVLFIDGEVLASLAGRWELLLALRREADLESMVLLVHQSAALGEAWRAVAGPPPAKPVRAPLVILADSSRPSEVTLVEGMRHLQLALNATAATAAVAAEKAAEAAAAPKEDAYDAIRRQAQRDAERALGVWRPSPEPVKIPPPSLPVRAPEAVKVEAPMAAKVEPPKAETPAVAAKVEPPKVEAAVDAKVEPPKVEAAPAKKSKRSRKAMEHFGGDADEPETAAPTPTPAPPAAPAIAAAPAAVDSAVAVESALTSSAPYLPLSEKPPVDELAKVARTSRNPQQRLELLAALKGLKSPTVVQALRDNVKSEDPAVRAAAEEGMATIFGPNWNRTRAVPKPEQPPASEDKNPNRLF